MTTDKGIIERMLAARSRFFNLVREARALQTKAYADRKATPEEKELMFGKLNDIDRTLRLGAEALARQGYVEPDTDPRWNGKSNDPYVAKPLPLNYRLTNDGRGLPVRLKFFTRVLIMRKWQIRYSRTGQSGACFTRLFEWQAAVDDLIKAGEVKDQLDALREG